MFQEARKTFETATAIIEKLKNAGVKLNLAKIYSAFASFNLMVCRYNDVRRQNCCTNNLNAIVRKI